MVASFNSCTCITSYQVILNELTSYGFVSNTFAATITLTVPEPGTTVFVMTGSGLIGIAALLRRRSARSAAAFIGWTTPKRCPADNVCRVGRPSQRLTSKRQQRARPV
jgi:PEP-CTERM motif